MTEAPYVVPAIVMRRLDEQAAELGSFADKLAEVERKLEPVETEYEQFITDFEVGLWTQHEDGEIKRLPSEAMRLRLAHKAMTPELLGRYTGLTKSRERLSKRIATLKTEVDAQRSILSALKYEMEAAGAGFRRAS